MSYKLSELQKLKEQGRNMLEATAESLQSYAAAQWPRGNQKSRIWELAKKLGIRERRMRSLFYAEPNTRISPSEAFAIQELLDEARYDRTQLQTRLDQLERQLVEIRSAIAREEVA